MAYVPVPKDLSKIKTKLAFNLTKRQLVCFSSAAAVGLPAYLFSRGSIGNSAATVSYTHLDVYKRQVRTFLIQSKVAVELFTSFMVQFKCDNYATNWKLSGYLPILRIRKSFLV